MHDNEISRIPAVYVLIISSILAESIENILKIACAMNKRPINNIGYFLIRILYSSHLRVSTEADMSNDCEFKPNEAICDCFVLEIPIYEILKDKFIERKNVAIEYTKKWCFTNKNFILYFAFFTFINTKNQGT